MRKYDTKRKEKNLRKGVLSLQDKERKIQAEHTKQMKGKKTILIPHPTLKNTWIEKTVKS